MSLLRLFDAFFLFIHTSVHYSQKSKKEMYAGCRSDRVQFGSSRACFALHAAFYIIVVIHDGECSQCWLRLARSGAEVGLEH